MANIGNSNVSSPVVFKAVLKCPRPHDLSFGLSGGLSRSLLPAGIYSSYPAGTLGIFCSRSFAAKGALFLYYQSAGEN